MVGSIDILGEDKLGNLVVVEVRGVRHLQRLFTSSRGM
jgi:hypothetical protein